MTRKKVSKKKKELGEIPFAEALERFVQTDPNELDKALEEYERLKQDAESLEKQVTDDQDRVTKRLKGRRRSGKKG